VNVMPVLPGITDDPAALDTLFARVAEAGARGVGACALRLQPAARDRYLPWIAAEFPALADRYRATYARGAYAGERYRAGLEAFARRLAEKHGLGMREYRRDRRAVSVVREEVQLSLGL
jgi:DNA repair photolyase